MKIIGFIFFVFENNITRFGTDNITATKQGNQLLDGKLTK